jgi:hypothetical protein
MKQNPEGLSEAKWVLQRAVYTLFLNGTVSTVSEILKKKMADDRNRI